MKSAKISDLEAGPQTELEKAEALAAVAEKKQLDQFKRTSNLCLVAGHVFTIIVMVLVLWDWIDLGKFIKTKAEELSDIQSRIGFVLRYSTPGAMWVFRCMFDLMLKRARCPAVDPTSGNEHLVLNAKNIFNNSFEQYLLVLTSNLILVQHLDGELTRKYIPAQFFLFVFGRFTFWLGYPKYRMFGFSLNFFTLFVTMGFNLYKSYEAFF